MSAIANYLGSLFSTPPYKDSKANKIANDTQLTIYRNIREILNLSREIFKYTCLGSLAGALVVGGASKFNISIFNLSPQSFKIINWKSSLAFGFGMLASNVIIGVLERRQLENILKEMFPECNFDRSTIVLSKNKLKIVDNLTEKKIIVIRFDKS